MSVKQWVKQVKDKKKLILTDNKREKSKNCCEEKYFMQIFIFVYIYFPLLNLAL